MLWRDVILGVDGVAAEKLSVADVASMLTGAQFTLLYWYSVYLLCECIR